ncbi:hypothetical protein D3C78_840880 [compost metagenome]
MLELIQNGTHERIHLWIVCIRFRQFLHGYLVKLLIWQIIQYFRADNTLYQYPDRTVGQLEHLPYLRDGSDFIYILLCRLLNVHL